MLMPTPTAAAADGEAFLPVHTYLCNGNSLSLLFLVFLFLIFICFSFARAGAPVRTRGG